jgi:hypothetical protein
VILVADPGEVERVPLKVVPIFIDEPVVSEPIETPDAPPPAPRPKTALLGATALAAAVIAGVLQGVAIAVATGGDYLAATVLGYLSIGLAVVAVVGGVVAIILDRGRRLGIAAVVLGVLANPFVLLTLFQLVGTLTT